MHSEKVFGKPKYEFNIFFLLGLLSEVVKTFIQELFSGQ